MDQSLRTNGSPWSASPLTVSTLSWMSALWAIAALLTATQTWSYRSARGLGDYPPLRLLALHLVDWLPWLALALACFHTKRLRGWLARPSAALFCLPVGVALALAKFPLDFGLAALLRGILPTPEIFANTFTVFLSTSLATQVFAAWFVLAAGIVVARRQADGLASRVGADSHLEIRSGKTVHRLPMADVDRIDAADYCALIHARGKKHLTRESLSRLQERLDPELFVRVHRSTIVNLRRIEQLRPLAGGDAELVLSDGERRKVSRRRRKALERLLHGNS